MNLYRLVWSPTGQEIATNIRASSMRAAKRKAPSPYKKYQGEIYAEVISRVSSPKIGAFPNPHLSSISTEWTPVHALRRVGENIEVMVEKGTLGNPARKRKVLGELRRMFSGAGRTVRKVLGNAAVSPTWDVLYTDNGVTRIYTSTRLTYKQAQADAREAKKRGYKRVRIIRLDTTTDTSRERGPRY